MKNILLIAGIVITVFLSATALTLAALGESIRHMEDPERSSYGKDI